MKTCSVCGETKALEKFCRDKRRKDGRTARCRTCHAEFGRQWREQNPDYLRNYYVEHRETQLAKQKAQREANIEIARARRRAAYRRNPEDQRERTKARYRAKREESLAYTRKWHREHPEQVRAYGRKAESKRRAKKLALPYEDVDPQLVFARDGGVCGICGEPVDPGAWHLDHIIPLAQGGHHTYANVQTAHPFCNISKGGRG